MNKYFGKSDNDTKAIEYITLFLNTSTAALTKKQNNSRKKLYINLSNQKVTKNEIIVLLQTSTVKKLAQPKVEKNK